MFSLLLLDGGMNLLVMYSFVVYLIFESLFFLNLVFGWSKSQVEVILIYG